MKVVEFLGISGSGKSCIRHGFLKAVRGNKAYMAQEEAMMEYLQPHIENENSIHEIRDVPYDAIIMKFLSRRFHGVSMRDR